MTMNMPPPYNNPATYMQRPSQGFNSIPSQYHPEAKNQTLRPSQQNIPVTNVNRSYSPNFVPQYNADRSYSPLNSPQQFNNTQNVRGVSPGVSGQNLGGHYLNAQVNQSAFQPVNRSNNFIRQPESYPHYSYPTNLPMYTQQSFPTQPHYQPSNHAHYQPHVQQPYNTQYYPQVIPQNYAPIHHGSLHSVQNQARKNIPEQSINSNFNYENANFDCNYSVQENLVHCVLCNQTYKTSQKKQHLELHREKVKNVNIRPVDQQQLKRLEKYNAMTKKGLMVKPIVEPDEFNVQYNPNEFVLRKVTQYKDIDAARTQEIQIQTGQNPRTWTHPEDLGYSESRRSQGSNPDRNSRVNRITESQAQRETIMNRNTNTRFNNDSVRGEQKIFLSDRFEEHQEGQALKSNYNPEHSVQESERRSQASQQYGYNESSRQKSRVAESISGAEDLGYGQESRLQSIREDNEEHRYSNKKDIPIAEIVNQVQKESQY